MHSLGDKKHPIINAQHARMRKRVTVVCFPVCVCVTNLFNHEHQASLGDYLDFKQHY